MDTKDMKGAFAQIIRIDPPVGLIVLEVALTGLKEYGPEIQDMLDAELSELCAQLDAFMNPPAPTGSMPQG